MKMGIKGTSTLVFTLKLTLSSEKSKQKEFEKQDGTYIVLCLVLPKRTATKPTRGRGFVR